MNVNFPLVLVLVTFVTGVVWLIDVLVFRRLARNRDQDPWWVEYSSSFFPVLLVVLILRSFIFEPFKIPSGSMIPTLLIGDFILVNKFSYGIRLPVIHNKIIETGSPKRGDVAVFRYPVDPKLDYIKRVVGVPGDEIIYRDKNLYINGEQVGFSDGVPYLDPRTGDPTFGETQINEDLLGVKHQILISSGGGRNEQSWEVPEGHYFMMGDNRDKSADSRYWGFVPEENLVGRAFLIWMNLRDWSVLWNRIGDRIK